MDFIVGLPKTLKGYTVIWVIVDRLTKSAHFLPGKATYTIDNWAQLYLKKNCEVTWSPSIYSVRSGPAFYVGLLAQTPKSVGYLPRL